MIAISSCWTLILLAMSYGAANEELLNAHDGMRSRVSNKPVKVDSQQRKAGHQQPIPQPHPRHQSPKNRANDDEKSNNTSKARNEHKRNERQPISSYDYKNVSVSASNERTVELGERTAYKNSTATGNFSDGGPSNYTGTTRGESEKLVDSTGDEVSTINVVISNSLPSSVGDIFCSPDPRYKANQGSTTRRNIIAMLIRNTEKMVPLIMRQISMMDGKYKDDMKSHFIVLHDGYLHMNDIYEVRKSTKRMVDFINVDPFFAHIPKAKGFDPYEKEPISVKGGKWSYSQMIKFWFNDFYDIPMLSNVDYYLRIDDDSVYLSPVINIFATMESKKAVYMANAKRQEMPFNVPGAKMFKKFVDRFVATNSITPKNPGEFNGAFSLWGRPPEQLFTMYTYDNNFEVGYIPFFNRDDLRLWRKAVLDTGCIYTQRWGDAPLRFMTMALFATPDEVLHRKNFNGIRYCHPAPCNTNKG